MVVIIDYGLGNLRSVLGAVERVGYQGIVSNKYQEIQCAEKLILPGVGAFGDGMNNIRELGLIESLEEAVHGKKIPILGICLGAQLLAKESFEFGHHQGLGWIDGSVIKFDAEVIKERVPHVGWNEVKQTRNSILFDEIPDNSLFYFVHSFYIKCPSENVIGSCSHGIDFTAILQRGNIYATQFHPEKSQIHGLKLLENFLRKG